MVRTTRRTAVWARVAPSSKGSGEDAGEFVGGEGQRVRFHAAGACGGFDDGREIGTGNAVARERGYPEIGDELPNPLQQIGRAGVRLAGDEASEFVVAAERVGVRRAGLERGEIRFDHVREQSRAKSAVRCRKHSADRAGETVDGTEAGVGKGESAEEAGERHVLARGEVATVFNGAAE